MLISIHVKSSDCHLSSCVTWGEIARRLYGFPDGLFVQMDRYTLAVVGTMGHQNQVEPTVEIECHVLYSKDSLVQTDTTPATKNTAVEFFTEFACITLQELQ